MEWDPNVVIEYALTYPTKRVAIGFWNLEHLNSIHKVITHTLCEDIAMQNARRIVLRNGSIIFLIVNPSDIMGLELDMGAFF